MASLRTDFGSNIKIARLRKNLTQEQLSELVDIGDKHLSSVEVGKKFVSYTTLVRLAEVLEVTPAELMGAPPPFPSDPPSPGSSRSCNKQLVQVICFAVPEGHPFLESLVKVLEKLSE